MRLFKTLIVSSLALVAASSLAQTRFPITVTHDSGNTTFAKAPERVVAMGPHMLDLILRLGVQPVGYATVGAGVDNIALGATVPSVPGVDGLKSNPVNVGLRQSPSLEVMLSLKPDLILSEVPNPETYKAYSNIAPTMQFTGNKPDDWRRTILPIARALGREAKALEVIAADKKLLAEARAFVQPRMADKTALMLVTPGTGSAVSTLQIRTGLDWASNIVSRLGVRLIAPKGITLNAEGIANISAELLPQMQPNFVIVLVQRQRDLEATRREFLESPLVQRLEAARRGNIFFVDQYLWSVIRGPSATAQVVRDVQRIVGEMK